MRIRVLLGKTAISFDTFNNPGAPPPERGRDVTIGFTPADLLVLQDTPAA